MRVAFSRRAIADLREIAHFIKVDNPRRAISFAGELRSVCLSLGESAQRNPLVPGRPEEGLRRAIYGAYLIFYNVDESESVVSIARILHSARDYQKLLFPSD
jgi:toxin ParE1/3/4